MLEISALPISLLHTTGVRMGSWAGPATWETAVDDIGDALKSHLIWRFFWFKEGQVCSDDFAV